MKSMIHDPSICEQAKQNKKVKLKHLSKKVILFVLFSGLFSCKEETNQKVKEATRAVSSDLKRAADSAKVKAFKVIDTAKVKAKFKNAVEKGAEKVEKGAKKLKESVKK
jgi:hypothetical protein